MSIKARLKRLDEFQRAQEGEVPPVDSTAFEMRLIWFPIFGQSAAGLSAAERAAVLALDPADYDERSRGLVLEVQQLIREEESNGKKH